MKSMRHVLAALLMLEVTSVAAEPVDVEVLVRRIDRVGAAEQAFPDVAGFTLRQFKETYAKANCPNASNSKGELRCRIECAKDDRLRLYLRAPNATVWPGVRGYAQPADVPMDIAGCRIASVQPVVVTYKSSAVLFGELTASYPDLISTIAIAPPNWSAPLPIKLRPFEQSAPALEKFWLTSAGREGLAKLLEFSSTYHWVAMDNKQTEIENVLTGYQVGTRSIYLRAAVVDTLGEKSAGLVQVSPSKSVFLRSVNSVENALVKKPYLNARELVLAQEVREIKTNDLALPK